MEISITAATRNRKFAKAMVRHRSAIERLQQVGASVSTLNLPFDILQLFFLDRTDDYARAVGCKGDRLFQVEVPTPSVHKVDFNDEAAFVAVITDRLQTSVKLCGLPKAIETQLSEAIAQFQGGELT